MNDLVSLKEGSNKQNNNNKTNKQTKTQQSKSKTKHNKAKQKPKKKKNLVGVQASISQRKFVSRHGNVSKCSIPT